MLKAVLDTSILVSAFLKHEGVNAKVLLGAKDRFHLYLSEDILEETSVVLLTYERIHKKYWVRRDTSHISKKFYKNKSLRNSAGDRIFVI